jgi:hypothetical protein
MVLRFCVLATCVLLTSAGRRKSAAEWNDVAGRILTEEEPPEPDLLHRAEIGHVCPSEFIKAYGPEEAVNLAVLKEEGLRAAEYLRASDPALASLSVAQLVAHLHTIGPQMAADIIKPLLLRRKSAAEWNDVAGRILTEESEEPPESDLDHLHRSWLDKRGGIKEDGKGVELDNTEATNLYRREPEEAVVLDLLWADGLRAAEYLRAFDPALASLSVAQLAAHLHTIGPQVAGDIMAEARRCPLNTEYAQKETELEMETRLQEERLLVLECVWAGILALSIAYIYYNYQQSEKRQVIKKAKERQAQASMQQARRKKVLEANKAYKETKKQKEKEEAELKQAIHGKRHAKEQKEATERLAKKVEAAAVDAKAKAKAGSTERKQRAAEKKKEKEVEHARDIAEQDAKKQAAIEQADIQEEERQRQEKKVQERKQARKAEREVELERTAHERNSRRVQQTERANEKAHQRQERKAVLELRRKVQQQKALEQEQRGAAAAAVEREAAKLKARLQRARLETLAAANARRAAATVALAEEWAEAKALARVQIDIAAEEERLTNEALQQVAKAIATEQQQQVAEEHRRRAAMVGMQHSQAHHPSLSAPHSMMLAPPAPAANFTPRPVPLAAVVVPGITPIRTPVKEWLESIHPALAVYAKAFADYGYDDTDMLCVAEDHELLDAFEELHVKKPHARKILKATLELRG